MASRFSCEWLGCMYSSGGRLTVEVDLETMIKSYNNKSVHYRQTTRFEVVKWMRDNVPAVETGYDVEIHVTGTDCVCGPVNSKMVWKWFNDAIRLTIMELTATLEEINASRDSTCRMMWITLDSEVPLEENTVAVQFLEFFGNISRENNWDPALKSMSMGSSSSSCESAGLVTA